MRFKNKVVIITGGAGGIGLATARQFAREGASLMVADLNAEKIDAAVAELKGLGDGQICGQPCDVSQEEQVIAAVERAVTQLGGLDVVVNNAGLMIFKCIEDLATSEWRRVLDVDLLGTFFFTREAFRRMRPGGAIVNISSIHAVETMPQVSAYAAAKAAVLSLTRAAALEGKTKQIRVNAVLPGAIDTPMLWDNPQVKAGFEKIERTDVGKPEDIAAVIAFLASSEAEFVNGASVVVDGGRLGKL